MGHQKVGPETVARLRAWSVSKIRSNGVDNKGYHRRAQGLERLGLILPDVIDSITAALAEAGRGDVD